MLFKSSVKIVKAFYPAIVWIWLAGYGVGDCVSMEAFYKIVFYKYAYYSSR